MPTHSALPTRAAAASTTFRSSAARRRPQLSPAERLAQLSARLDILIRDVGIGPASHREHDRHVGEAEAIAAGIRAVFRAPTPARPVHPPLGLGVGKGWW
jgi:hypothetical protein